MATDDILQIGWNFDNSYARLSEKFYSKVDPSPVSSPKLITLNFSLAAALGLSAEALQSDEGLLVFGGNRIPDGAVPISQAYAGHQFGYFTLLGDGRALLLGEQITPEGDRFDIQLKGSGRTPYSRGGDGRAALGPMLREYIISEAMYALGIATTRSLCVVTTGEPVYRETVLPGAILTRVAASHIRVGTFQYAAKYCSAEELRQLADYTIRRHFPYVYDDENRYLSLLKEAVKHQASLIAKWMLVGFIHGVMNTDNMAISGETIDYGPCAFMDVYDPATVFSSIDVNGRYAYGNQPDIASWNLARFAETLLPLLHNDQDTAIEMAQSAVSEFNELYHSNWLEGMKGKLGIYNDEKEDEALFEDLLSLMKQHHLDYTNTFRALTLDKPEDTAMKDEAGFKNWHEKWQGRLGRQQQSKDLSVQLMRNNNPVVIPRNHRVEEALDAAVKNRDFGVMERLLAILASPYAYSREQEEYTKLPPLSACRYRTFCGT